MNDEKERRMRRQEYKEAFQALCVIFFVMFGFVAAAYVGLYLMLIKPIVDCIVAFKAGALGSALILWSLTKCVLSFCVGWIIFWGCITIARKIAKLI